VVGHQPTLKKGQWGNIAFFSWGIHE